MVKLYLHAKRLKSYQKTGYVFEALDRTNNRKVALKRIEKVGTSLSREYEILFDLKDCENIVQILVSIENASFSKL